MDELFRNVKIEAVTDTGQPYTLYANVTDGQYEILMDRGNYPDSAVMSVYGQITPMGEVGPRVFSLRYVSDVQLWEPPPGCGIAREWPDRV